jgi:hypothetical protein
LLGNPDTDGDGLKDGDEVSTYGTSPTNPDSDGGGVPDGEELLLNRDPKNPTDDDPGGGSSVTANVGTTCGTAAYDWYSVTGERSFVHKGEEACIFLISNPLNRELLRVAIDNNETLTDVFGKYLIAEVKDDVLKGIVRTTLQQSGARLLIRLMPQFSNVVRFTGIASTLGNLAAYQAIPLHALFVINQIETKGACIQVVADVDQGELQVDWALVYNPAYITDKKETVARVYQKKKKLLLDEYLQRRINLRCGSDGLVHNDNAYNVDQVFSSVLTSTVVGA